MCIRDRYTAEAVIYTLANEPDKTSNIGLFAIISVLISIIPTYFFGLILNMAYAEERKRYLHGENVEDSIQNIYFIFYLLATLAALGGMALSTYLVGRLTIKVGGYWFATMWVGWFMDFLILDVLCVVVAKAVPALLNLFKNRGYYFDYDIYEKIKQHQEINRAPHESFGRKRL
eukprot:TRINITY_DN3492_c0_g2_i3.p1 TRINITY_DN3492_c0_g2~~TRINITY_DN3492_c0_g2_i3.p1  ORF type:complete len:189 (-),score=44.36 TRINITY_DN3492_c0_g2_i3:209-730(-)